MQAFGSWIMVHEDVKMDRAAALHDHVLKRNSLAGWRAFVVLMERKHRLTDAAVAMATARLLHKAVRCWMQFTYYRHIGHVALNYRVRRLGCVTLREWLEVSMLVVVPVATDTGPAVVLHLLCCNTNTGQCCSYIRSCYQMGYVDGQQMCTKTTGISRLTPD